MVAKRVQDKADQAKKRIEKLYKISKELKEKRYPEERMLQGEFRIHTTAM